MRDEILAHVQVACARTSAQPFHRSADGEISAESGEIERNGSGRLIDVEHDACADAMRLLNRGPDVLKRAAPEKNERDWNERRAVVDRVNQFVDRRLYGIVRADVGDLRPGAP